VNHPLPDEGDENEEANLRLKSKLSVQGGLWARPFLGFMISPTVFPVFIIHDFPGWVLTFEIRGYVFVLGSQLSNEKKLLIFNSPIPCYKVHDKETIVPAVTNARLLYGFVYRSIEGVIIGRTYIGPVEPTPEDLDVPVHQVFQGQLDMSDDEDDDDDDGDNDNDNVGDKNGGDVGDRDDDNSGSGGGDNDNDDVGDNHDDEVGDRDDDDSGSGGGDAIAIRSKRRRTNLEDIIDSSSEVEAEDGEEWDLDEAETEKYWESIVFMEN
jgi:hypothetical protein